MYNPGKAVIDEYLSDNAQNSQRRGANPLVVGSLVTLLSALGASNISCNGPDRLTLDKTVKRTELQPYQIEFLKKWKQAGKPYMFENCPDIEEKLLEKGINTKNPTDAEALIIHDYTRALAGLAGMRRPDQF